MSSSQPEMVLFDLDGTLVDSVPDLCHSLDAMLRDLSLPLAGEDKVRVWVGNGAERLVKRGLTNSMDQEPETDLLQKALPLFYQYYRDNTCNHSQLYAGVREGIDYLHECKINLGCVTNKPGEFTEVILNNLGLADDFGIVISGDTLDKMKPHPLPLLHAADYFHANAQKSLMIGDSVNDVQAARAAGFQVLCVSYGYNLGQDISLAQPDHVVDSLTELRNIF